MVTQEVTTVSNQKINAFYKIGVKLGAQYVFVCFPFQIQCIEKAPVHSTNQAQEMHILE